MRDFSNLPVAYQQKTNCDTSAISVSYTTMQALGMHIMIGRPP